MPSSSPTSSAPTTRTRPGGSATCRTRRSAPAAWWSTPASTPSAGAASRAIALLHGENGNKREQVESEVDRYCSWPGQACGYKVGHSEIVRQRERATAGARARLRLAPVQRRGGQGRQRPARRAGPQHRPLYRGRALRRPRPIAWASALPENEISLGVLAQLAGKLFELLRRGLGIGDVAPARPRRTRAMRAARGCRSPPAPGWPSSWASASPVRLGRGRPFRASPYQPGAFERSARQPAEPATGDLHELRLAVPAGIARRVLPRRAPRAASRRPRARRANAVAGAQPAGAVADQRGLELDADHARPRCG